MAFYTQTIETQTKLSPAMAFVSAISRTVARILAAQDRGAEVRRMQNLSDQELADIGLTREGVVRHVYHEIY